MCSPVDKEKRVRLAVWQAPYWRVVTMGRDLVKSISGEMHDTKGQLLTR